MVIGDGLIATAFSKYKDSNVVIFASGISNSTECDFLKFQQERFLLEDIIDIYRNNKIVYFSSVDMRLTPYFSHKKQMEDKKRSLEELAEEYEKYDVLFEDLKTNGFKSPNLFPLLDPIYIYIDANGNFIYTSNGNHRLYMAIIIGLKEMPVRVWARHTDWQRKRELLFLQGAEKFFALYPNLKGHPDLDDCKRKYE